MLAETLGVYRSKEDAVVQVSGIENTHRDGCVIPAGFIS
jgi:hypothetical protein